MCGVWLAPAAAPKTWSSTSESTPPCTNVGGPSYAAPSSKSTQDRLTPSVSICSGGAIALRSPMIALPQLRPNPSPTRTP